MAGYGKNDAPVESGGYGPNDAPVASGGYGSNDAPVEDSVVDSPVAAKKQNSGVISDMATSFKRGVEAIPGIATGLADIPFALAFNARPISASADALGKATGFQPGQWAKDAQGEYSPEFKSGQEQVNQAWAPVNALDQNPNAGVMDYLKAGVSAAPDINRALLSNPGYTANQVVESLPSMLAGGAASKGLMVAGRGAPLAEGAAGPALPGILERTAGKWAAPIAGGVGEGAVQAGQQMDHYDGEDQRKNAIAALGSGALDAAIAAGGGRLANKMGLETPETLMAKLGSQKLERASAMPLRMVGGAISEGVLQEAPQSAQEQVWSNYVEGKPLMSGVLRQAVEGGIAGGVMGAGANMSLAAPVKPPGLIERAALRGQPQTVEPGNVATPEDLPTMAPEDLAVAAQRRMESIVAKLNGTPDTTVVDPATGQPVVIPGEQKQIVTPAEQAELQFLTENAANPQALAEAYGVQLATAPSPAPDLASQIPARPAEADPAIAEQQRLIDELNTRLPAQEQAEQPKFSRDNPNDNGAHEAATSPMNDLAEPTQGQIDAGTYKVGRQNVDGLKISVENPEGSTRRSHPDAAKQWENTVTDGHYGYIRDVPARSPDGEHVDAYVKPGTAEDHAGDVFVVNQVDPETGKFDETKNMIGYGSAEEAKAAYMSNYEPGWKGFGDIVQVPMSDFKAMLQDEKAFQSPVKPVESPIPYEAPRFLRDTYKEAKDKVETSPLPLPPQSRTLEKNAHALIDREGDAMVDRYIKRFGNVVDPDQAKLMFSEFELKPELAAAFHEPSSRLSKMVYAKLLATRPGKTVLFSAGGGGSGKSVALEVIAKNDADIADSTTFDGTLASYKSSKAKIDTALDAGAPVRIIYTNREVGKAFEGAMERSRVVPIDAIIDAHVGAAQTIRRLAKEYAGNPNVEIEVINNNGSTIEEVARGKLDDIPAYSYDEVKGRLYEQAKRALAEGRIDQRKYEILVRGSTRGGAGKGQAAEQGQVAGPVGARAGEAAAQDEVAEIRFSRREGAAKKPLFNRITETGHRREASTGRYVGAPDWVGSNPVQLGLLRKKLRQLATEGESGRYWYEKSSKAVMDLVGGDKVDAEKFVGLLAIYSQGTEVSVNLGFALEAYYQWKAGLPIDTGRFPTAQTKKAETWLKDGKDWGGIKTNNFYADLMEEIDPSKFDEGHATMDMWMAIAFDYGMKVLDQGPKYNFAKRETARLAKELGWKPHQVQAAIWTAIKARTETSEKERNAAEIKAGIATKNGNAHAIIKGKEYEHFRTAHKFAMDKQITPKEIADRGVDFADALKARAVQMSWEATPGVTTGVLPGIHNATTAQLSEYLVAVDKALHGDDGRDLIAELINLHNPPTLLGFSAWQGKIGAGAQSFFPVPVTGQGKDRAVLPVARDLLNGYAALKGYILSQEAVVWHHAVHGDAQARNNGAEIRTQRALTEDEMKALYDGVSAYFSTTELAPAYTANGARILNFVDGLDNKAFQKGVRAVMDSLPEGFGGGDHDTGFFRSDGDYISNDWKEHPNGEGYIQTFTAGRPDLLGRADDLRAVVAQVNQDFSDRYGWGKPSFSRSDAASNRRAGETNDGASYGEAREGSVQVDGVHYSVARRAVLDGAKYGTGMRGAESARLDAWSATPEQRKRIHFYVDEGSGIRPESGVGSVPHAVRLNNVYDSAKDPLGLWAAARAKSAMPIDIANHFEQAVMAAGFDGYYESNVINGQGVAVLLGDHKVSTAQPKMSRAEGKTGNVATPADAKASKAISVLNTGMARYLKDTAWENAYAPGELHDTLSAIGEALEVGFGTRVIPIRPTGKRFDVFNGVHFAGNIYVNTQADVGFANIAGHELFHELKRKRPDLFQWFAEQSRQYYKDFDAYQKKLNSLLQDGEAAIDQAAAEEELLSDFAGDSLADPVFLQQLADASPTKFRQLLMAVRAWIDGAIAKLKGNKSERYVTDLQAMRDNLSKALVAFAEGKPIAAVKQTETAAFKKWFGDSKVVDENGAPLVVYRGDREGVTTFNGNVFFTSSRTIGERYAKGGQLSPVFLAIKNPLVVDAKGNSWLEVPAPEAIREEWGNPEKTIQIDYLAEWAREQGHDGLIVTDVLDQWGEGDQYVAFDPAQIKSATGNVGTFDATNPDIRFSQRSSGEFFSPLQRAFQNAKMQTMTGTGWSQWLKSNMAKVGVKKDEVTWSGINEYLELRGKDKISKEEVAGFLEQNGVSLGETVLGAGDTSMLKPFTVEQDGDGWNVIDHNQPNFPNGRIADGPYAEEWEANNRAESLNEGLEDGEYEGWTGPSAHETKFAKYVPNGGIPGTYREILVTLPVNGQLDYAKAAELGYTRESIDSNPSLKANLMERFGTGPVFKSSHWKDTPNVLVHLRVDEVKGDGNKRLMRVVEIQSDYGQEGKKEGFGRKPDRSELAAVNAGGNYWYVYPRSRSEDAAPYIGKRIEANTAELAIDRAHVFTIGKNEKGEFLGGSHIPPAPFVTDTKSWVALGIKRAIQQAVANNVEGIVFATGQENADLYDLSKQIGSIEVREYAGVTIAVNDMDGEYIDARHFDSIEDSGIADYIGKEMAMKIAGDWPENADDYKRTYSGLDLKVGGEGMRAFYDQIVPSVAKDVLRQLGMPTTLVIRTQLPGDPRATATTTGGKWGVSTKDGYVDSNRYETQAEAREAAAEYNRTHGRVQIDLTPALISTVNRDGIPLFTRRGGQTETAAFKKWFGDSRVVDENGDPMVVYHGTATDLASFDPGIAGKNFSGKWDWGIFFTNNNIHKATAKRTAGGGQQVLHDVASTTYFAKVASRGRSAADSGGVDFPGANVMPVYVSLQNPLIVDGTGRKTAVEYFDANHGRLREQVLSGGHDGVIIIDRVQSVGNAPETLVVALRPTQIKSAIGNRGTFDEKNPDIRFSRRQNQPYDIPEDTKLEAARRQVQDKFLRFQTIQEAIELTTAKDAGYTGKDIHAARQYMLDHGVQNPITDATDVYQAETLSSSRIASRKQDFREDRIEPLLKKTAKAGVTMDEIADYLLASHAQEANARVRTIRKDPAATAFGMTDQEAATSLQAFQARRNFAEIDALANEWRQITEDTKRMLVTGGIISQGMADAWDNTYSHYVPLKGVESQQGAGKGLSVNGKQKRRMGHGSREEAVIANILRDYERAVTQVERNKVGMTLVRFALEVSDDNIITLDRPVQRPVFKDGKAYEVLYHGSVVGVFSSDKDARAFIALDTVRSKRTPADYTTTVSHDPHVVMQASPMLGDNEVNVYVAGQVVRVQINDELAARAYTNMGVEGVNKILSGAREFNTWLSKAYTGYNPEFLLRNLFRDAIQGTVTLTGKFGAGTMAKIYSNYPAAMKELSKHYARHGSSQIVSEARADGMQIGSSYLSDIERIGDDVMTAYNEYAGMANTYQRVYAEQVATGASKSKAQAVATMKSGIAGAKRVPIIGHFLSIMEHLNAVVENSLRLATYRTLRDQGVSREQAAAAGKNLMNFNRKGEVSNQAGALYLFFNPNMQGTHVMLQALTSSKYKRQAQALTGIMALAAFALAEMGRGGGDDDEDKWKKIPSYVRDRNMVIMVGDKQITIPVPYGFGVFHSLGNAVSDFVHGESGWKLGLRMMSAMAGNFSPFGNPMANDNSFSAFQLLPTIPKMALGPEQNENSFGAPLAPVKYSDAKPDSQNMFRSTKGTIYSALADGMNEMTGGSKYQKGLVDVSPETLRFWVSSLTGGTGRFMVDSLNLGSVVTQGASPELREIPMARVLVREESINDVRRAYWDRVNEAGQAAEEFAAAKRAHDGMAMREIMDDNRTLIRLSKYADRQQKLIKAKRDLVDRIRQDETLSLTQQRDKIKQVEAAEEKIYNKFISAFDDAKGEQE